MNRSHRQLLTPLLLTAIATIIVAGGFLTARAQETQSITALKWSPDSSRIVGASNTGFLRIWDAVTSDVLQEFQGHTGIINTISWSPDSTRFATTSSDDKVVRIWNAITGEPVADLEGDVFYEGPAFVAWNPNGTMLVSVASVLDGGALLQFWSTASDDYQPLPITADVSAYDIAWSPDGTQLAVADYRSVYIFEDFSAEHVQLRTIAPFQFTITWSPDGTQLAGSNSDGLVQIFDIVSGQTMANVQTTSGIASLAWTPDGKSLIGDTFEGVTYVWDTTTGELVETLSLDRQGGRFLMSLSPYGGRLALGNSAPVSETSAAQAADERIIETLANGAVQIVVPAPSLERLHAIAQTCRAPLPVEQSLSTLIQSNRLDDFIAQVEALPEGTIPPACAADLLAVAGALQR